MPAGTQLSIFLTLPSPARLLLTCSLSLPRGHIRHVSDRSTDRQDCRFDGKAACITITFFQSEGLGRAPELMYIHRQNDGQFLGWTASMSVRHSAAFSLRLSLEHHYLSGGQSQLSNMPRFLRVIRGIPCLTSRVADRSATTNHHILPEAYSNPHRHLISAPIRHSYAESSKINHRLPTHLKSYNKTLKSQQSCLTKDLGPRRET